CAVWDDCLSGYIF
nr:immunoglobulin light chain junction region [Macaca mulatta]MPO03870.1 immunoglobulin light chain junction region [Macaca mulatta]MPO04132.1 immunoglobulin light chain junction region [Macaca mulatta]MPO04148.1 immunoglobulin light chain junction region [Macaca mulatta]MPO04476.1 immunoglobulin light chain junction region [Macaca mulatta]